ncbi:Rapid ALkalinization Factor [Melia azedarach]|uniref:Rapid ALkalinization Factor n=1 Tax=Melia azedarach TaxID=155640 RepID=A0ACC1WXN0_MELAZ|nr:Rapid ALkalinization Factor [Melia azedarach]
MGSKLCSIFVLLSLLMAATAFDNSNWGRLTSMGHVEDDNEMLMPTEVSRRQLNAGGFISYGALRGNSVPCNQRGSSYYNCNGGGQANPYQRGCSAITNCQRWTG